MIANTRRMTLAAMTACAIALALPAAAQPKAGEPLKIGFVYVSPIGDAGWTFQHDTGRKEMEKALGGKVTTKYIESVPEGADAERVIRELASTGHNLIFTTSFGYMNPTIKVAQRVPQQSTSSTRPATRRRRTSASTTRASTRAAISRASSPARCRRPASPATSPRSRSRKSSWASTRSRAACAASTRRPR